MKGKQFFMGQTHRWKHFDRKNYSAFRSLNKEVTIGVLATATLLFANPRSVSAQKTAPQQIRTYELGEVEVTGTRVPLTELKSAKMVTVLSRSDIARAGVHSVNDLLKYATGVDVRQRGGYGIQTDISVSGGTFDQVTILLNGINISSPQTGHLTADFPVAMDDIERVEILEGPSARVFGTSAFTGAINIVTKADRHSNVTAHLHRRVVRSLRRRSQRKLYAWQPLTTAVGQLQPQRRRDDEQRLQHPTAVLSRYLQHRHRRCRLASGLQQPALRREHFLFRRLPQPVRRDTTVDLRREGDNQRMASRLALALLE
jgi:outer membrane receptor for ferrienterochelin and colicin